MSGASWVHDADIEDDLLKVEFRFILEKPIKDAEKLSTDLFRLFDFKTPPQLKKKFLSETIAELDYRNGNHGIEMHPASLTIHIYDDYDTFMVMFFDPIWSRLEQYKIARLGVVASYWVKTEHPLEVFESVIGCDFKDFSCTDLSMTFNKAHTIPDTGYVVNDLTTIEIGTEEVDDIEELGVLITRDINSRDVDDLTQKKAEAIGEHALSEFIEETT